MATEEEIHRYSGSYSLPTGEVPYVDGKPQWPYAEPIARRRLEQVAHEAGIALTGDEELVSSGSNDAWVAGDSVVRICWRGDLQRLPREIALLAALPPELHHAETLDAGTSDGLTWSRSRRIAGIALSEVWTSAPEAELRCYAEQLAELVATLHTWHADPVVVRLLEEAAVPDGADALTVVGRNAVPEGMGQLTAVIDALRGVPFMDLETLDRVAERFDGLPARSATEAVVLHGDITPWNVLVDGGRIVALLDYEYARLGDRRTDLAMLAVWRGFQEPPHDGQRLTSWLRKDYPAWFAGVDEDESFWQERCAWALRGCLVWPPDAPLTSLDQNHPLHLLRRLLLDKPA